MVIWISQEEQKTTHHPRAHCFAWVHSSRQNDSFPTIKIFQIVFTCNGQIFAIFASKRLAEHFPWEVCISLFVALNLVQVIPEIWVAIGNWIGKQNWVIVVREGIGERKWVVLLAPGWLGVFSDTILKVIYFFASLMPWNFVLHRSLLRVHWNFHAEIEKTIWLRIV